MIREETPQFRRNVGGFAPQWLATIRPLPETVRSGFCP